MSKSEPTPEPAWTPPSWALPYMRRIEAPPAPKGLLVAEPPGFGAVLADMLWKGLVKPIASMGLTVVEGVAKEVAGMQAALVKYGRHLPKCDRKDHCSCGWTKAVEEFLPKDSVG
jgi:hypothetical protein